mmetsp:Transcript_14029/g.40024  ORF Transcript_14029/g.40024 Transcript_14029/m.40024 type:complete len:188 (-) Transcript_14029:81-644(-)
MSSVVQMSKTMKPRVSQALPRALIAGGLLLLAVFVSKVDDDRVGSHLSSTFVGSASLRGNQQLARGSSLLRSGPYEAAGTLSVSDDFDVERMRARLDEVIKLEVAEPRHDQVQFTTDDFWRLALIAFSVANLVAGLYMFVSMLLGNGNGQGDLQGDLAYLLAARVALRCLRERTPGRSCSNHGYPGR